MRQTGNFGQSYPNEVNTIIRVLLLFQKFLYSSSILQYAAASNCNWTFSGWSCLIPNSSVGGAVGHIFAKFGGFTWISENERLPVAGAGGTTDQLLVPGTRHQRPNMLSTLVTTMASVARAVYWGQGILAVSYITLQSTTVPLHHPLPHTAINLNMKGKTLHFKFMAMKYIWIHKRRYTFQYM